MSAGLQVIAARLFRCKIRLQWVTVTFLDTQPDATQVVLLASPNPFLISFQNFVTLLPIVRKRVKDLKIRKLESCKMVAKFGCKRLQTFYFCDRDRHKVTESQSYNLGHKLATSDCYQVVY